MPTRRTTRKRPARPRVPLPRQTGGVHPEKTRILPRKQKHKRKPGPED